MEKTFAKKGVKAIVITTLLNEHFISKVIGKSKTNDNKIHVQTIEFPSTEASLSGGCENTDSVPSLDLVHAFCMATGLLQDPLEQLLLKERPNCIVANIFFPWAIDATAKFGIPRLVFHGNGFFSLCADTCTMLYVPFKDVSFDFESFLIPNLPDHLRNVLGRKAWHIGPLSLCYKDSEEKAHRGKEASIDRHECLNWLETKKPNSVIYICFGSLTNLPDSQLREIAMGLEASGQQFMWVVRKNKEDGVEWLPDGLEKRMEGKGLIIRGWAPPVLILEDKAIGAFVTQCGWNSTLEAVSVGVPMITWPFIADQFFNEKLVTEVLKFGVPVGAKAWAGVGGDIVRWDAMEKAVKRIMTGEEAIEMKNRTKVLSELAKGQWKKEDPHIRI
ncbi:unnamed protein product [Sphenostylis stenocarpa]|uniref:Glycosyltransferase n=1 Tax=Sphenostylis stenocarpa TaxID=92480 RepID=A0AA86S500_9FABA|nr:unnamed protein product [Sphenostylis stenocarpa]